MKSVSFAVLVLCFANRATAVEFADPVRMRGGAEPVRVERPGYAAPWVDPGKNLQQLLFPGLALGIGFSATLLRMTRSSMIEVLREDYVRTAWAKGLRQRAVVFRHALKNAMIAPITLIGTNITTAVASAVIIETIFSLPGIGRLTLDAIQNRDYPQLQGNVLFIAFAVVMINLAVDISYAWFDPRIRYG